MKQPVIYVLIGLPGCGKTDWVNNQEWITTRYKIMSHTDFISKKWSKRYNIIINDINLTKENRKLILNHAQGYKKVGVCFKNKDVDSLVEQLTHRGDTYTARWIPIMADMYEYPSLDEGFDDIWYSN